MHRKSTFIGGLRILLAVFAVLTLLVSAGFASDEEKARLYFAYGSNLDEGQMAERCFTASIHGLAQIKGYRFVINGRGVATIVKGPGDAVEGVLWRISPQDERILDLYEGVATGHYVKKNVLVEDLDSGEIVEALVYIATESELGTPRPGYLEKIIRAAEKHGFTELYLEKLKEWE